MDTRSTAEDARRALKDVEYQILVTDLYLPDGLGLSLLEPRVPENLCAAILVTGALDENNRRASEALGFHKCFAKPLSGADLVVAIRTLTKGDTGGEL